LALDLFGRSPRRSTIRDTQGEARAVLAHAEPADLVVASYLLGEMGDTERRGLADLMWARTSDTLLVVDALIHLRLVAW
jgi:hypothetical protein